MKRVDLIGAAILISSMFILILLLKIYESSSAIEAYKSLGAMSMVILWLTCSFVLYKWHDKKATSFSWYAAKHKSAYILLATSMTVALLSFYWFSLNWLVPTFRLSSSFNYIVAVGIACELTAAWIPKIKGNGEMLHNIAAYLAGIFLLPAVFMIYGSSNVSYVARSVSMISSLCMMSTIYLLCFHKKGESYSIYLQSIYIFGFHVAVLAATYLR